MRTRLWGTFLENQEQYLSLKKQVCTICGDDSETFKQYSYK